MKNQDSDMYRHIAAFEKELKEMKALRDVPPGTSNRFEAMEAIVARMKNLVKEKNKTTAMSLVNTETCNKAADVNTDIAALERELKEIMGIGYNSPRTANRLDAMEGIIERMKNSEKHFDKFCLHISMCFFRAKEVEEQITGLTATVIKDGGNYVDFVNGYIQQIDRFKNYHEDAKTDLRAALLKFCRLDLDQTWLQLDQGLLEFIPERENTNESEIESVMRSIEQFETKEMDLSRRIRDLYTNFLSFFPKKYAARDQEMNRENIVPESTTFPSVQSLGMETSYLVTGGEASVPPSPPPLEKQLQGLQLQLDEMDDFREKVRAIGMQIQSSIRQVQASLLPFYRGQTVPDVLERPKSLVGVLMENYIQLVKVLYSCPMLYYTSSIPLRGITQSVVSILAFMQWIETGDVLLYTEVQERLGLGNFMFGLDIEDYFSGLCLLSNDLISFVVSRVGAGDYACLDKVLNFMAKLLAAFAKLSLRNSFLQEKFDVLKANLSKVEGATYDVKVFGFRHQS